MISGIYSKKYIDYGIYQQFKDFIPYLLVGITAALLVYFIGDFDIKSKMIKIIVESSIFLVFTSIILLFIKDSGVKSVINIVSKYYGKKKND
jgi:hypothetical protein